MISEALKFVFVHVPKTGGNSIQNICLPWADDRLTAEAPHQDGSDRFQLANLKYPQLKKHSTLADYHAVLGERLLTFRTFATIRNPWDRMISHYFSPHLGNRYFDRNRFIALVQRVPTIEHFISYECREGVFRRRVTRKIDFLMRFENLNADFREVCRKLVLPFDGELPVRNKSNHQPYSYYYDEDIRELVRDRFAVDIELGNYEF